MSNEIDKSVSLDDVLDATLDQLADMPEWKPFPAGAHKCSLKWKTGVSANKNPTVTVTLSAIETIELQDKTAEPLKPGSEATLSFTLNNEIGQGKFKQFLGYFMEHLGMPEGTKNRQILEAIQGMEAIFVTVVRQNKDKTQSFTDVVEVGFA